jgi:hypothetical protein
MSWKVGDVVERVTENRHPEMWGEVGGRYSVIEVDSFGDIKINLFGDRDGYADRNSFKKSSFEVGDVVCLRPLPDEDYVFGRGLVEDWEVGTITNIDYRGYPQINFPSHNFWRGRPQEVFMAKGLWGNAPKPKFELSYQGFPSCCTGRIISSFGGSRTNPDRTNATKEGIIESLRDLIDKTRESGGAFVSCTTNNQQKDANEALKEVGFKPSKWMSKTAHPETKVRLWHFAVNVD